MLTSLISFPNFTNRYVKKRTLVKSEKLLVAKVPMSFLHLETQQQNCRKTDCTSYYCV